MYPMRNETTDKYKVNRPQAFIIQRPPSISIHDSRGSASWPLSIHYPWVSHPITPGLTKERKNHFATRNRLAKEIDNK